MRVTKYRKKQSKTCSVCDKPHSAKGYCSYHYVRFKKRKPVVAKVCKVEGCGTYAHGHYEEGYCGYHHTQARDKLYRHSLNPKLKEQEERRKT